MNLSAEIVNQLTARLEDVLNSAFPQASLPSIDSGVLNFAQNTDRIRVRNIINKFSYQRLVQQGIIPDLLAVTSTLPTKKYPPWIYTLAKKDPETFPKFGIFMEILVTTIIQDPSSQISPEWLLLLWRKNFTENGWVDPGIISSLSGSVNFFRGILEVFRKAFAGHSNVKDQHELNFESVSGHPDLWSEKWILDVKTCSSFKSMQESSFLQILAYGALSRANGHSPEAIGILLPLQRQILFYDIRQWDSSAYLCLLNQHAKWVHRDLLATNPIELAKIIQNIEPSGKLLCYPNIFDSLGFLYRKSDIGHHTHKADEFPKNIPIQIYLTNPKPGENQGHLSQTDIIELQQKSQGVNLFVHGILNINIAFRNGWELDRIRDQLKISQQIGARGVVIHVGKFKQSSISDAWANMYANVCDVLSSASEDCPLVLETPAGQKSEMLSDLLSFGDFYELFTPDQRKVFKLCVDTQHVFSAGYDPAWYLKRLIERFPGSVRLVHFNDSRVERGACRDRHAPAGLGYIGYLRLRKVHQVCRKAQISMVTE